MLTWAERLILYNQYEILKRLDPEDAEHYDQSQEIVARGYEIFYSDLNGAVFAETLRPEVAREVMEILDMFRAITFSCKRLRYKPKNSSAEFEGFDGNEESEHFGFAKFLREKQGKWGELSSRPENSHRNVLGKYRRMVNAWRNLGKKFELTENEIEQIASA